MQNAKLQELKESAWRRPLSPEEQARLRNLLVAQPTARSQWESDADLTRVLNGLPAAPVSSNFTALVLREVERAQARPAPASSPVAGSWFPAGWLPRLVTALAMVCLSLATIREYQIMQREKMSRDLASVSRLATLPPVDWLQNFETINRLNRVKVADDDLLLVLQ